MNQVKNTSPIEKEPDDPDILVKVENVSKRFCRNFKRSLWYGVQDIGKELMGRSSDSDRLRKEEFWAIQNVSFELRRGECLGLIGHNGAGKSTLLKMLNGLIKPDTGKITIRGRIGALIELGTGMNPLLSGRENVYINGQILGFSKKEIDEKLDDIIDFSEIGDFIDSPVQNYSSGMRVRLGFAIASQMEPDVLLIDEVLAVGDIGFRTKCFNRIQELIAYSAVIFVSHSMPQVGRIATKLLLMKSGKKELYTKKVPEAIEAYYNNFHTNPLKKVNSHQKNLTVSSIFINDKRYEGEAISVSHNKMLTISLEMNSAVKIDHLTCNYVINDKDLKVVASSISQEVNLSSGKTIINYRFKNILSSGFYFFSLHFLQSIHKNNSAKKNLLIMTNALEVFVKECEVISPSPIIFEGDINLVKVS